MSNSSTIVLTVLALGIAVRAVLDLSSIVRSGRGFDIAYGLLFLGVGAFGLYADPSDIWAYVMIAASVWYAFRYLRTISNGGGAGRD